MCPYPTYLCTPYLSTWLGVVIHGIFSFNDLLVATLTLTEDHCAAGLTGAHLLLVYLRHQANLAYLMPIKSNYHINSIRRRGTIYCITQFFVASIREQLLFESAFIKLGTADEEIHCLIPKRHCHTCHCNGYRARGIRPLC